MEWGIEKLKVLDREIYLEDFLFDYRVVSTIEDLHSLKVNTLFRHVLVGGFETDVVALCSTDQGYDRWVGFELKDSDILKALNQALWRRRFFDYFYVVIDLSVCRIVDILLKKDNLRELIMKEGVGIISVSNASWNSYAVVVRAKYKKRAEIPVKTEYKEEDKAQLSLVNFVREINKRIE